jgi:peptide/nickel transport system permease protein
MASFIVRRLLYSLVVLLIASFAAYAGVRAAFDPLAKFAAVKDQEVKEREKVRLGLDQPIYVQYGKFIVKFAKGDWGTSDSTRESVATMIQRAMGKTLQLIIPGIIISLVLAISLGVYSAVKQYSVGDYLFTTASFVGIAMPPFWFGLLAIEFLAIRSKTLLGLKQNPFYFVGLHSGNGNGINADYARHLVLPVLTLTVQLIAGWSRFQRAAMLDVLSADYVRTAKAKGVPRRRVIMHHAFRNALIPLVTVVALDAGALFGGLIITEQIFSISGMGRLFVGSLQNGDAPVLAAWTIVAASFVIIFNLFADVAYGVLDPRVRLS